MRSLLFIIAEIVRAVRTSFPPIVIYAYLANFCWLIMIVGMKKSFHAEISFRLGGDTQHHPLPHLQLLRCSLRYHCHTS